MGTQRPRTNTLNRGDVILEGTVLKRTHSDSQNHIILTDSPLHSWPSMEPGPSESTWLSQGYIPALREIGEWRVVIVNETIQYVVHMIPQMKDQIQVLSSKLVEDYYSLVEILFLKIWTKKSKRIKLCHNSRYTLEAIWYYLSRRVLKENANRGQEGVQKVMLHEIQFYRNPFYVVA